MDDYAGVASRAVMQSGGDRRWFSRRRGFVDTRNYGEPLAADWREPRLYARE